MRTRPTGRPLFALFAAAMVFASFAEAQERRRPVIRLDEISVEGRIQKPQAFYILPRSNLNYEGLEMKESFVPRIREALDKEPF